MSRTDKDRPMPIQHDDSSNRGRVCHNHTNAACDYAARNNTDDYRNRYDDAGKHHCARQRADRPDSYFCYYEPVDKWERQLTERRRRGNTRRLLRLAKREGVSTEIDIPGHQPHRDLALT